MKKKATNKRRMIFILLFVVIMIPLLILSRIRNHHHVPIGKPFGKIGFYDARSDQQGLLLPWINTEDALKREMNWVTHFINKDGEPTAMCDRKAFRKNSWQEGCQTDVVHNFIDPLKVGPEFRTN